LNYQVNRLKESTPYKILSLKGRHFPRGEEVLIHQAKSAQRLVLIHDVNLKLDQLEGWSDGSRMIVVNMSANANDRLGARRWRRLS